MELAANLDRMEATSSRNELVRILSDVYRACSTDELEPITYLIQGRLAPFFEPIEIGLGERLLLTAIAVAYGAPKDEVIKLNRQTGDLGVTAEHIARRARRFAFGGRRAPAPVGDRGRERIRQPAKKA